MTGPTVVDTTLGRAEIEFGINRWVAVTIGSETGQAQLASRFELAGYLQRRGLTGDEAEEIARKAWSSRPRTADTRAESAHGSVRSATGLSSGAILLLVLALLVTFALVVLAWGFAPA